MAYFAVNKNGEEVVFNYEPSRSSSWWEVFDYYSPTDYGVTLPKHTIFQLIGRNLTWEDEPYLYD